MNSVILAPAPRRRVPPAVLGVAVFLAIAAAALTWSKWAPYGHRLLALINAPTWSGGDILARAGAAGSAPSLAGAWTFTRAYAVDVWKGFLAALLIGAAVQSLIPKGWLLRLLARRTHGRGSLAGGLAALPSLMCTCCTAPMAVSLRREGVPTSSALAYWVGNPVLNPAVIAFLVLVAPWQWVVVRLVVGGVLVFGATALVARWADGPTPPPHVLEPAAPLPLDLREAPLRFARSFARLAVSLIPTYVVVVFLLGLFRGWLFPLDAGAVAWALPAVLAAAVLGAVVVIPTAGEIPIAQALAAAGVGAGAVGALLITLPAISVVSMAMVARAFSVRVTLAMGAAVVACGLLAAALLWMLSG